MNPYYKDDYVTIYHGDCREIVPELGQFDLLLTDPPYGINVGKKGTWGGSNKGRVTNYGASEWDKTTADKSFLSKAIVSSNYAIVWGGNYYELPPCKGPLVWDKQNTGKFADGEMAWNNLGSALRIFRFMWNGMLRQGEAKNKPRQHPTQKPLELMTWCITLAGDVQTILDPFAGSGTTGRAAKDLQRQAVLIEKEEKYCEIAANRMRQEVLPLNT